MDRMNHNSGSRLILVAEDTDTDFYLLERSFQDLDSALELTRVSDGVETIEYLAGEGQFSNRTEFPLPHLLLLDLKMPRKDGFAVLQWVCKQESLRWLPVVIFTSSGEPRDIRRAYELGATSYIVKPMFAQYAALVRTLADYWLALNEVPEFSDNGHVTITAATASPLEKIK